jgi:hypothetical protein
MKKLVYTLAAAAALTVGADRAAAQYPPAAPGPVVATTTGGCSACGHSGGHGKLFGGGHGLTLFGKPLGLFGLFGGGGVDPRAEGRNAAMGGQLVFPQHPFVRSPRDFFMMDR